MSSTMKRGEVMDEKTTLEMQRTYRKVCEALDDDDDKEVLPNLSDIQEALAYIESQQTCFDKAERALLQVNEEILPQQQQQQPVTVKGVTADIRALKSSLAIEKQKLSNALVKHASDSNSDKENAFEEPLESMQPSTTVRLGSALTPRPPLVRTPFAVIGTLSDVVETDNETDTTTPASAFSSTKKSLTKKSAPTTSGARTPSTSSVPRRTGDQRDLPPSTGRKRHDAFLQLEFQLQRDVHKVMLPTSESLGEGEGIANDDSPKNLSHDEPSWDLGTLENVEKPHDEAEFSNAPIHATTLDYSIDDDSALYCATVIADSKEKAEPVPKINSQKEHRPSIVEFLEDRAASPNQTFLTMDDVNEEEEETASIENDQSRGREAPSHPLDAIEETSHGSVFSQDSNETPILDRYRLVVDENSPRGVRVVPNARRKKSPAPTRHGSRSSHTDHLEAMQNPRPSSTLPPRVSISTPSKSSAQRQFRKTPHPRKRKVQLAPTIDENAPLNDVGGNDSTNLQHLVATPKASAKSPLSSILSSGGSSNNTSLLTSPAARPRALLTSHPRPTMADDAPPKHSSPRHTQVEEEPKQIKAISVVEYEDAPRIVKMQVTLTKVLSAIQSINEALRNSSLGPELTEKDLCIVLGATERETRKIVMSLCHWRRLLLRRLSIPQGSANDQEIVFDVITNN